MTDERGVLRRIAWRELFPWLVLFRAFRLSISPTLLLVATAAVFLSNIGWPVGEFVFLTKEQRAALVREPVVGKSTPLAVAKYMPAERSAAVEGFDKLADPFFRFFSRELTIRQAAFYLFASLWSLAIWSLAGGIITRRAVVEFGLDETPSFVETVKFAARRYLWYFLAPLYPLFGVLLLTLPIAALGLVAWLHDFGFVLAGLLWIFAILAGVIAAWLLAGLLFGWPLMWGTISAERDGDAFEAFSRSFSYVYGKPLHYLFYAIVAALFGSLCWAVVSYAGEMVIEFGFWAYSWGAGAEKAGQVHDLANSYGPLYLADSLRPSILFSKGEDPSRVARCGAVLIGLSMGLVRLVTTGFIFSFFWCVAGAIYLLLRQDVDDKEFDDVYVPAEAPNPRPPLSATATPPPAPEPSSLPRSEGPPDQRLVETVPAPPS